MSSYMVYLHPFSRSHRDHLDLHFYCWLVDGFRSISWTTQWARITILVPRMHLMKTRTSSYVGHLDLLFKVTEVNIENCLKQLVNALTWERNELGSPNWVHRCIFWRPCTGLYVNNLDLVSRSQRCQHWKVLWVNYEAYINIFWQTPGGDIYIYIYVFY